MKILVINGANLNKLGERDPARYGTLTLSMIETLVREEFHLDDFEFYQSSYEGDIVERLHKARNEDFDGIIINPGGYAHTSVVIKDALELIKIPKIEVHLSNLAAREEYRQILITASACDGYISGLKEHGYTAAAYVLQKLIKRS